MFCVHFKVTLYIISIELVNFIGIWSSVGCELFHGFISLCIMDLPVEWVEDLPILPKDHKMNNVCNEHEVGV